MASDEVETSLDVIDLLRLVADVVGQLDLHRPLEQVLGQLGQQTAQRSPPRSLTTAPIEYVLALWRF
jgi:hypothetical protein